MKKILYTVVLVSILLNSVIGESISGFYNTTSGLVYTEMIYLKTTFVNQNPTSAVTGEYVYLLFKIENWGTENAENVTFELLPQYPFSLDPGMNAKQDLGTITGLQRGNNAYLVKYKVKVDKDAIEGDNEIKIKYSYDDGNAYNIQAYNVSVSNSRTDFYVIIQDTTGATTTLAIANTGANTAYSTIIKIPEQENFIISGTSASIIGNLDAGDYTLVSFDISSTRAVNTSDATRTSSTSPEGFTSNPSNANRNITVEISYTDELGIRRTVQKQVPFNVMSSTVTSLNRTQSSSSLLGSGSLTSGGLLYIVIGVVGIVIIVAILKLRKRKKK